MRALLVEDSKSLSDTLVTVFEKEHYLIDTAYDGQTGYEYAVSGIYDIVILDLMLPKMNGYEVLKRLRQEDCQVPILVLSAKSELEDKVDALDYGADDYLTKPFEMKELLARVRAITKRRGGMDLASLSCGNLTLDIASCEICNNETGKRMQLAGKEYQLMEVLLYNQKQVLPKEQIVEKVWGYDSDTEYNNVEVYVSFLRRKMNFLGVNVQIRVVRGIGYIIEETKNE